MSGAAPAPSALHCAPPPGGEFASWQTKQVLAPGGSFLLDPHVRKVRVGLAWDAGVDVDSSAVLLDRDLRVVDLVWFRKLASSCGSVSHSGDDRTGEGGGDDETISVKLSKLSPLVHYVLFTVNVFNGANFAVVRSCAVHMNHGSSKPKLLGRPLMEFNISQDKTFAACRGLFMCVLSRRNAWWSVHSLGLPATGGTAETSISAPGSLDFLRGIPSEPIVYARVSQLVVMEARGLAAKDSGGTSDPLYTLSYKKLLYKSEHQKETLSPVWATTTGSILNLGIISAADFKKVVVKVEDWDRFSSNDFLGKLVVPVCMFFPADPTTPSTAEYWLPLTGSKKHPGPVSGEVRVRVHTTPL